MIETTTISDDAREAYLEAFQRIELNTTPGDAMLLRILVQVSRARRGVEVGTATGYGALQLGIAFERTGGTLLSLESDPERARTAREHLRRLGLDRTVTVIEGDALQVLPNLEGEFDFVFLDALKREYLKYFQALAPKLARGAVVVADNVIRHASDMKDFLDSMQASREFEAVTIRASLEKSDGMAIYYKVR